MKREKLEKRWRKQKQNTKGPLDHIPVSQKGAEMQVKALKKPSTGVFLCSEELWHEVTREKVEL